MSLTPPRVDLLPDPRPIVGGARHEGSDGEHEHRYAATGAVTASIPLAGGEVVDAAVAAARGALRRGRAMAPDALRWMLIRAAQLVAADADRLTALQTLESGTPSQFARATPGVAADFLAYYAGWSDKGGGEVVDTWPMRALDYTMDEPYGVVAVIVPWNAPLVSLAQVAGAALAAGNCVVLKPSELAPFSCLRVAELFAEAGMPDGMLNVVPGGAAAGEALVSHPGVDKVHFTGCGETARKVLCAASEHLTPVGLELGGKSAHVIFADANVRAAARQALSGLVINSGQGCVNGTRVLVQDAVYDEVLDVVTRRLARLSVGDPMVGDTIMGPVVSERACDRILAVVERARAGGHGRLVAGGERLGGDLARGYFVAPTVFAEVQPDCELSREEIFGPVLSFARFSDEDDAVEQANDTRYGLAAYLHTSDVRRAHRVAGRLQVGNVWINGFFGVPPSMPFGGTKQSGHGRVGGRAGIREFVRSRNVWLAL